MAGIWSKIKWVCGHDHKDSVPMIRMQGSTPFWACPKYMRKDEDHPLGREDGERACANRISFYEESAIVEMIEKARDEALLNGEAEDFTGARFRNRQLDATILKFGKDEIIISVLNRKAIS